MIETIIRNFTLQSREKIMGYINYEDDTKSKGYIWFFKLVSIKYMKIKGFIEVDLTDYESIMGAMNQLVDYMEDVFTVSEDDYNFTKIDMENEKGVIKNLRELSDEFFSEIEIIGWIYQYYRSVRKEEVLKLVKKNNKVEKENIPAVTQLFTPKWIVKYMVENSVGKMYLELGKKEEYKKTLRYYVDNQAIENRNITDEYLRVLDPAMGTGHILVYVFDLLYEMYKMEGFNQENIVANILSESIFGFDIDIYSEKLTKFSLYMKAREKDKDIFKKDIHFNIFSFEETSNIKLSYSQINKKAEKDLRYILDIFKDAKNLGSIIKIEKDIDFTNLYQQVEDKNLLRIIRQGELLSHKYHVIITNPPYMGKKNMNKKLARYINENYPKTKNDLFSVFMDVKDNLLCENGILAMITPHSWMFLSSFKDYREDLSNRHTITSLLHLGSRVFNLVDVGTIVQAVAFVLEKQKIQGYEGIYHSLVDYNSSALKEEAFLKEKNKYIVDIDIFKVIKQHPFSYWVDKDIIDRMIRLENIGDLYTVKQGMTTSDNKRFLRFWHEVDRGKIGFNMADREEARNSGKKWFPYNKGGVFKKWYGNNDIVVNYENDGYEMVKYTSTLSQGSWVRIKSRDYYFKEAISWPYITDINNFGPRYIDKGFIFDVAGPSIFIDGDEKYYIMGILSSPLSREVIRVINPTMNFQVENIKRIPVIIDEDRKLEIIDLVKENIALSKLDYDLFERSWNFIGDPLLAYGKNIELGIEEYCRDINSRFYRVKENEEKINKIINQIYNLEDELEFEVKDYSITMTRVVKEKSSQDNSYVINKLEIVENLIGYLIGCILGRYELENYKSDKSLLLFNKTKLSADVVENIKEVLIAAFGRDNFKANYEYICRAISPDEDRTNDEKIRDYFIYKTGFYNEHNRKFQGSPIYFLFESGKKNAMKGIFYAHTYKIGDLDKLAGFYASELKKCYEKNIGLGLDIKDNELKLKELSLYRKILLSKKIEIDLDEGIKNNYGKFQNLEYKGKSYNILTRIKL